jgi:putative acyl-CoA dehydrogenase
MADRAPETDLATHSVTNQPPPFENVNLYTSDVALREAVAREGAGWMADALTDFGARTGSAEVADWARRANRQPPELRTFDRFGHRIDEVDYHPAYHWLMDLGLRHGVSSIAWTADSGGHAAHAALLFLMAQAEAGVCCPMSMTYACVPPLRHQPDLADAWIPRVTAARYDPASAPAPEKTGATIGMAMTEKQGGSDVRANSTQARPLGDGAYDLVGHKWFCSAPMSDAFLTLAHLPEAGLTCFLVPRWRPDGTRNAIRLMRLKDKLGDRANASGEIEYHGAWAQRVGEPGRGVRTIIEMVQHTRLDCTVAPAALMRQAVANAAWHAAQRTAFQRHLIDQPLMQQLLADLAVESEAATALAFRLARSFDGHAAGDDHETYLSRLLTPVAKYWLNKRLPGLVYEAMEAHGGAGYVEEHVMPRIYRQAPLNSIWEGAGNVICLDVLRALQKTPEAGAALMAELRAAQGADANLDRAIGALGDRLARGDVTEGQARRITEQMALALQGALLVRHAPPAVADAFCAARLGGDAGLAFGTLPDGLDTGAILDRARPAV